MTDLGKLIELHRVQTKTMADIVEILEEMLGRLTAIERRQVTDQPWQFGHHVPDLGRVPEVDDQEPPF